MTSNSYLREEQKDAEIERLRDEIERLRGLLAECDGYLDYAELNLKQRVREALGDE